MMLGYIVSGVNHETKTSEQLSKKLNLLTDTLYLNIHLWKRFF